MPTDVPATTAHQLFPPLATAITPEQWTELLVQQAGKKMATAVVGPLPGALLLRLAMWMANRVARPRAVLPGTFFATYFTGFLHIAPVQFVSFVGGAAVVATLEGAHEDLILMVAGGLDLTVTLLGLLWLTALVKWRHEARNWAAAFLTVGCYVGIVAAAFVVVAGVLVGIGVVGG